MMLHVWMDGWNHLRNLALVSAGWCRHTRASPMER